MESYTFKTYISNRREHFCYGRDTTLIKKDFPFPESLLKLLRLDIWQYEPLLKKDEGGVRGGEDHAGGISGVAKKFLILWQAKAI